MKKERCIKKETPSQMAKAHDRMSHSAVFPP